MTKRAEDAGSRPLSRAESLRLQLEGSSSWDKMVAVANRSAVLRCPECGATGAWEETPGRRRVHLDAIPTRAGREAAGTDVKAGVRVHAAIGQEWRCSRCEAPLTRDPKVGRIGSTKENTQTGKGRMVNDANSVEDNIISLCDALLKRWKAARLMSERDDNAIQGLPAPFAYEPQQEPAPANYAVTIIAGPTKLSEMTEAVLAESCRAAAQSKAREFCRIGCCTDSNLWFTLTDAIDGKYPAVN